MKPHGHEIDDLTNFEFVNHRVRPSKRDSSLCPACTHQRTDAGGCSSLHNTFHVTSANAEAMKGGQCGSPGGSRGGLGAGASIFRMTTRQLRDATVTKRAILLRRLYVRLLRATAARIQHLNAPDALNLWSKLLSFQATLLNAPLSPVLSGSAVSAETFCAKFAISLVCAVMVSNCWRTRAVDNSKNSDGLFTSSNSRA